MSSVIAENVDSTESTNIKGRWKYPVAGVFIMMCIGNVYSWSVFAKPLQAIGWTPSQTTLAFQISIIVFTIAMIFSGRWLDKTGPKPVAIFSGLMMGLGFISIKFFGHSLFGMIISFSVVAGIGMGAGYVTPLATALKWYPDKRGLMSGLVVMGMGFGSIFGGMGGPLLIDRIGIWNTFLVFGSTFGTIIVIAGFILKNPPEGYKVSVGSTAKNVKVHKNIQTSSALYDYSAKEMMSTVSFYMIWLVFLIGTGGGLMVISQASPFGQNVVGLTPVLAGSVIMIMGLLNGVGRPIMGSISDRVGRRNVIFIALVIQILVLLFILPYAKSYFVYAVGVSLMGFSYGGFLGTMPSITADYYGIKNVGFNYGWIYTGWGAAGYFGPQVAKVMVGGSFDRNDWNNAFYFIAIACAVGIVIWFFTKPPIRHRVVK